MSLFHERKNLFLTGPGGSGKSELIRTMQRDTKTRLQVCAMTGCASQVLDCNARTLHSWAGIGLGKKPADDISRLIRRDQKKQSCKVKDVKPYDTPLEELGDNPEAYIDVMRPFGIYERWLYTDTLIVDEVSMMSRHVFELLDDVGRIVRGCRDKPFGGMHVVFVGDFYQLPPCDSNPGVSPHSPTVQFCFHSPRWFEVFPRDQHVVLHRIFRQNDMSYINVLNQVRVGRIQRSSYETLLSRVGCMPPSDMVQPTMLFPKKHKVAAINHKHMEALSGESRTYRLSVQWNSDIVAGESCEFGKVNDRTQFDAELQYLRRNVMCDDELQLKLGAQVMCIVNLPDLGLYNGSQGIVESFDPDTGYPVIRVHHPNGRESKTCLMKPHTWTSDRQCALSIEQIPLVLSWALTIHKSQGASLDAAIIDIGSDVFEHGQSYVALSRVKSIEGLYLVSFDLQKIQINQSVHDFYQSIAPPKAKTKTKATPKLKRTFDSI